MLVGDRRERLGDVGLVGDGDGSALAPRSRASARARLGGLDRMVVLSSSIAAISAGVGAA